MLVHSYLIASDGDVSIPLRSLLRLAVVRLPLLAIRGLFMLGLVLVLRDLVVGERGHLSVLRIHAGRGGVRGR